MIRFIDEHRNRFSVEFICKMLKNSRAIGFITSRGYRQSKARLHQSLRYRFPVDDETEFWKQNPPQVKIEIKANA